MSPLAPTAPLTFVVPGRLDQATGGYRFARQVVEGLRERGRTVQTVELPGTFPQADAKARDAAATLLRALPDQAAVVIDGLALPAFDGMLPGHAERLRVVGFVHHPLAEETGLSAAEADHFRRLEGRLWPMLRGVLCPSATTARSLRLAGVPAGQIAVVPPGTARSAARLPQPPSGPLRLLAVGTVTPRKGHLQLVQALAALTGLAWTLDCIGSLTRDPACTAALRDAIDVHGLAARVRLHGEQPEAAVSAAYGEADAFVLPSLHEGYGMAFAEALAHGLPIVTTHGGALAHTVPATAALHVPPGHVPALREALQHLLTDRPLRERLAAGARRAAQALPDAPTSTGQWLAALDRLIA